MRIIRKHDAIVSLIPGAELIMENDVVVQWIKPTECNLTDKQIEDEIVRLQAQETANEQSQATAKASAISKLTALGLTSAEITALTGVTV